MRKLVALALATALIAPVSAAQPSASGQPPIPQPPKGSLAEKEQMRQRMGERGAAYWDFDGLAEVDTVFTDGTQTRKESGLERIERHEKAKSGKRHKKVKQQRAEWPDGIVTVVTIGKIGRYAETYRDGQMIGRMSYDIAERKLWVQVGDRPAFTYDDKALVSPYSDGWLFEPDADWLTVQSYVFQHSDKMAKERKAKKAEAEPKKTSALDRALNRLGIVVTVEANDPGCDDIFGVPLHYLDGTMFLACCSIHDKCYQKVGCGYSSWFIPIWQSNWLCGFCNGIAAFCFGSTATGGNWFPVSNDGSHP